MDKKSLTMDEFFHQIPKVDLHYHLLGGVRMETMLDFANKYGVQLSEDEAKCYYRAYQHETPTTKGGIEALTFLYQLMKEPEDYCRVLNEVAEDAAESHIKYIETFWNPSDTTLDYKVVTNALIKAIDDIEEKHSIIIRLIPSINREKSPEEAITMVKAMIDNPHPYVLGIGIDYKEQNSPVEHYWKAYQLAQEFGYKTTAHCSEFGLHWRNVESGIELINVDRIDHGYTIIDNAELTEKYAQEGIPFTVIPSNTYYLKQWPDYHEWVSQHPIREMAEAGLVIIPCTDDWHIHNTTGANCYRVMCEDFGFDLDSIKQLMLNGIQASWLSDEKKKQYIQDWSVLFDLLRNRLRSEPTLKNDNVIHYKTKNLNYFFD
ncbi:adenosine deaminase [Vibrio sp. SS-MA-C1-2]|uniref:adenosine deaminase family protein n=1 Tax=Vibrio sp. SS-MA-C1-2 TaxID=2908646 RepID=UPI001F2FCF73|nr:adenosine deaminase [Vibrio sp. SS-MA-C1-2]UJF18872.1 adenosine deaminase [Vibrio sp. SS-MA-C1-2]